MVFYVKSYQNNYPSAPPPSEEESTSSLPPCITSCAAPTVTPPHATTPSTASYITTLDSAPDEGARAPLTPAADRSTAHHATNAGRGSFDDITPELPQKGLEKEEQESSEEDEESEDMRKRKRRRDRGAHSFPPHLLFPPLQDGGEALLHQLKALRDAPLHGRVEGGGGAIPRWKYMFSGNRKEPQKQRRGITLPAERVRKEAANQRGVTGGTKLIRRDEGISLC